MLYKMKENPLVWEDLSKYNYGKTFLSSSTIFGVFTIGFNTHTGELYYVLALEPGGKTVESIDIAKRQCELHLESLLLKYLEPVPQETACTVTQDR